jgi:hypothetical protein
VCEREREREKERERSSQELPREARWPWWKEGTGWDKVHIDKSQPPSLVHCGSSRKSRKLRRSSLGDSTKESQAAFLYRIISV